MYTPSAVSAQRSARVWDYSSEVSYDTVPGSAPTPLLDSKKHLHIYWQIYLKDETLAHSPNMGLRILSLAIVVTLALVRALPSGERADDAHAQDSEDMKDVNPGTQFNRKSLLCVSAWKLLDIWLDIPYSNEMFKIG